MNRGSDVFLKEDLSSILRALLLTNEAAVNAIATPDQYTAAYRAGFGAAIVAMASALDIEAITTAITRRRLR